MTSHRMGSLAATLAIASSLAACAGMTPREHSTAVGAGIGAPAGAGRYGPAAGAAVGGVTGNQVKR
jgi:osmotically inducible lipoprotein OsmB